MASVIGEQAQLCRGGAMPIALRALVPVSLLEFDLYVQREPSAPLVLYRTQRTALDQVALDRLAARGIKTLYIRADNRDAYQQYLRDEVVHNEQIAPSERYRILCESTRTMFDDVMRGGDVNHVVAFTNDLAAQVTEIVCHRDMVMQDLFSLMEHDYYTYTHAMGVCSYAVALAKRLEICEEAELPEIAAGGLLHDIGKKRVDIRLLNKPGPLQEKERSALQQHPKAGFELLCQREDLGWGQLMMVYQHHERLCGKGYPTGAVGDDIHPWARICSIVDIFHAMTTVRPYHDASSFDAALECLERLAGSALDADMVDCWAEMVTCT